MGRAQLGRSGESESKLITRCQLSKDRAACLAYFASFARSPTDRGGSTWSFPPFLAIAFQKENATFLVGFPRFFRDSTLVLPSGRKTMRANFQDKMATRSKRGGRLTADPAPRRVLRTAITRKWKGEMRKEGLRLSDY